jgi:tripeptidyl-peptidase-1
MEVAKLGMQGVTVVVSSGDSGVGEARGANIANCLGPNGKVFSPDYRESL